MMKLRDAADTGMFNYPAFLYFSSKNTSEVTERVRCYR